MALSKQRFLILSSLATGPKHGYALISDIKETTSDSTTLRPGTLYHALEKMKNDDLINLLDEEVINGRVRRRYEITTKGRETLGAQAREQAALAEHALTNLGWT